MRSFLQAFRLKPWASQVNNCSSLKQHPVPPFETAKGGASSVMISLA
jgi:hypothetical protein